VAMMVKLEMYALNLIRRFYIIIILANVMSLCYKYKSDGLIINMCKIVLYECLFVVIKFMLVFLIGLSVVMYVFE